MKYLIAKLTINCHQLYHEIWSKVLLIRSTAPVGEHEEDLSSRMFIIPTFACYLRNIWIELIEAFHISSADDAFAACMSMMNHSLEHSPRHPAEEEDIESVLTSSSQCVCGECGRHSTSSLSIRDEGEILRTHFRNIAISIGILVER